jgi:hypothetical protein
MKTDIIESAEPVLGHEPKNHGRQWYDEYCRHHTKEKSGQSRAVRTTNQNKDRKI